jgi:hypothetical protein
MFLIVEKEDKFLKKKALLFRLASAVSSVTQNRFPIVNNS